jgi:hypothetical protein
MLARAAAALGAALIYERERIAGEQPTSTGWVQATDSDLFHVAFGSRV